MADQLYDAILIGAGDHGSIIADHPGKASLTLGPRQSADVWPCGVIITRGPGQAVRVR